MVKGLPSDTYYYYCGLQELGVEFVRAMEILQCGTLRLTLVRSDSESQIFIFSI